jgi:hypothetical protein
MYVGTGQKSAVPLDWQNGCRKRAQLIPRDRMRERKHSQAAFNGLPLPLGRVLAAASNPVHLVLELCRDM